MKWNAFLKYSRTSPRNVYIHVRLTQPGEEVEALRPLVLVAKVSAEDNPIYNEAMNGLDAEVFREAMQIGKKRH